MWTILFNLDRNADKLPGWGETFECWREVTDFNSGGKFRHHQAFSEWTPETRQQISQAWLDHFRQLNEPNSPDGLRTANELKAWMCQNFRLTPDELKEIIGN